MKKYKSAAPNRQTPTKKEMKETRSACRIEVNIGDQCILSTEKQQRHTSQFINYFKFTV